MKKFFFLTLTQMFVSLTGVDYNEFANNDIALIFEIEDFEQKCLEEYQNEVGKLLD